MKGDGVHTMIVGDEKGNVILRFPKPVEWVALDPETARQVAESIARTAYKARFGDTPTTEKKSQITEQLRTKLKNRVTLMLRTFSNKAPVPPLEAQAVEIVDQLLNEVG